MMNKFIEFRNNTYEEENHDIYPILFLEKYINENLKVNLKESILIDQIRTILQIEHKKSLSEKDIDRLCSFLGANQYIDRFAVDTILKFCNDSTKDIFGKKIRLLLSKKEYNNQKLYHVLDICIECNIDILDDSDILFMLEKFKENLDILSILMDYMDIFKRDGFKDHIYGLLKQNYPGNIKLQMLDLLVNLYPIETLDKSLIKNNVRHENNKIFYDTYIDFLTNKLELNNKGISILQSMFYGDFEDSGKGNNGGLAVLLKDLGDEIAKNSNISSVFTITIDEKSNKPFISYYGEKHVFIRLPIYLDHSMGDPFIKRELFIKRYIGKFLKRAGIEPDVFHIRYLDNASKAVANLSKELNSKLVFTLTLDPHRNMSDEAGNFKELDFSELIEKLNKIKIGDELVYLSDGIVGLGKEKVGKELKKYFPQFKYKNIDKKVRMIGEGIQIDKSFDDGSIDLNEFMKLEENNKDFFKMPIILNVGRLSIQKGQIELLKAWSNSKLSETHNLLIIGGDLEKPSDEEKTIIGFFNDYIEKNPRLKDRFIHKGAMENEDIRLLERNIIKKDFKLPHIYLCSSIKEEFGIAILEAMAKGFLAMGPIKGGVKSYIKNEINGFLINTSNWKTIAGEAEKYIYDSEIDRDTFKTIQAQGQRTVIENFSMEKISKEFLSLYLFLKGVEYDEI